MGFAGDLAVPFGDDGVKQCLKYHRYTGRFSLAFLNNKGGLSTE